MNVKNRYLKTLLFLSTRICVPVSVWGVYTRRQLPMEARVLYCLELELQVIVSYLTWVLGVELRSSARAVHALTHRDVSLTP